MVRLQKVIAEAGLCSRRKAEALILEGRVRVNGEVVDRLGVRVDPQRDRIEVDGKPLAIEPKAYIALHKPKGVITSVRDPRGRRTVVDLLPEMGLRLYPVGRLDYDTSGLLLLTNDGELAFRLTHPSFGVEKVYIAELKGCITDEAVRRLERGVPLEDGLTSPARVKVLRRSPGASRIEIAIHEGRNRQVRRMAEAVGFPVVELIRVRFGPVTLDGLKSGEHRRLSPGEVAALRACVNL